MTLWSPDTCGCQIEFDPHPDAPDTKIIHRKTVKVCDKHLGLEHTQAHADAILAHNQQKNIVQSWIREKLGNLDTHAGYDRTAPVGNDPIVITKHGLTGSDLNNLQMQVDAKFGVGVVQIV